MNGPYLNELNDVKHRSKLNTEITANNKINNLITKS